MSETPLSPKDQADLDAVPTTEDEAPKQRSLLELWQNVLNNVDTVVNQPIPINVALKVVSSWPFLSVQDTESYHGAYHEILRVARDDLNDVLREHPEAFGWVGEKDAAENHELYLEVLVRWHNALDTYEEEWRAGDELSHVWLAAIADARATLFSGTGFIAHLDNIGLEFSDEAFVAAVRASRGVTGE